MFSLCCGQDLSLVQSSHLKQRNHAPYPTKEAQSNKSPISFNYTWVVGLTSLNVVEHASPRS